MDVFHGKRFFQNGYDNQMGDLFRLILLPYRIGNELLFHIIADHGRSKGRAAKRCKQLIDIKCSLLQIKTCIRKFLISWKLKLFNCSSWCDISFAHILIVRGIKSFVNEIFLSLLDIKMIYC